MTGEEKAREKIDAMLIASRWVVQSKDKINLCTAHGVTICELSFKAGDPDYTLFVDGSRRDVLSVGLLTKAEA